MIIPPSPGARAGRDRARPLHARALVVPVVLALMLGACGTSPSSPPTASGSAVPPTAGASGEPGPSGTLTVGLSAEVESMDPHLVYQNAGRTVAYAIFDPLLTVATDGTLGPGLATAWRIVDDTTIELTLRDDVTFHDGEPMDADAVRFSIYRILDIDPATDEPIADETRKLASQLAGDYSSISRVEVVDPTTVRVLLNRPDAALPAALGRLFIVPPDHLAEVGNEAFGQAPVGTGPFEFVEWQKDDHSTVRANPDYWDSPRGQPQVDTVVFRPLVEAATRVNELTAGGVDIIMDVAGDQVGTIEGAGATVATLDVDPHHYEVWLNQDGGGTLAADPNAPPAAKEAIEALGKREVRVALNMAIDRATIIDTLLGGRGDPMTHAFANGDLGYQPDIPEYPYDPEAAQRMLADAGYPNGLAVDMDVCTCDRSDLPEAVAAELAKIGVTVTIKPFEVNQFNSDWAQGNTSPMRASRLGFNDPNLYLQFWLKTGGLLSRYSDPEMDALIGRQATEYDLEARRAILREIALRSHEDAPAIWLWRMPSLYGVGPRVESWSPHFLGHVQVVGASLSE